MVRSRSAAVAASVLPVGADADVARLRVEVQVEHVEQPLAGLLLVLGRLLQVPGDQRQVVVLAAIGPQKVPPDLMSTAEYDVAGPPPLGGAGDDRLGVGLANRARVGDRLVPQLVVAERLGVHVAVGVDQRLGSLSR